MLDQAATQKLAEQLIRHEGAVRDGFGLHMPYRCPAGALTVGYGHNLDANPVPGIGAKSRLNDGQAYRLLLADIKQVEDALAEKLPDLAHTLAPVRWAVLVNMAFNLGVRGLMGFRDTLIDIMEGNYKVAATHMLHSLWARQVGGRAVELANQMRSGEWQC
ncbi:hypothetical protein LJC36_00155 [Desulfovibrio sp. OttesenSCG-928-C14]|nr:hypothetical protein [Desulfovibrio sp. OttesenSCG-928-C14]